MAGNFAYMWFYSKIADYRADLDDYGQRLLNIYQEFDEAGYDVVQVVPIGVGRYEGYRQRAGTYVAMTPTEGAVVIGKSRNV